jgi:hypothetical protein
MLCSGPDCWSLTGQCCGCYSSGTSQADTDYSRSPLTTQGQRLWLCSSLQTASAARRDGSLVSPWPCRTQLESVVEQWGPALSKTTNRFFDTVRHSSPWIRLH